MDLYKKIIRVIESAESASFLQANVCQDLTFKNTEDRNTCRQLLESSGLETEAIRDNILRLYFDQKDFKIFNDINDFKERINKVNIEDGNLKFNVFIVNGRNLKSLLYKKDLLQTFVDFEEVNTDYTFSNAVNYFRLLNFLKEQEHKEDQHFYFVDHFNGDHRKIIMTSLKKEGKLTIGYPKGIPDFDPTKSIKPQIDRFISSFEEKQLPKFIKAEVFNVLPSYDKNERLFEFIQHLDYIMERAEQNFEIYLSDLSLDNFKNQFLEFRLKYFNQFRDILSKITTQILAFPLSITASAFATYKVNDSILLSCLIVIAFIVFSIYSLYTLKAHKDDINEIKRIFLTDYESFINNPFFQKYPLELNSFKTTYDYIIGRTTFLNKCINIYSYVLIITNILFVIFVLIQTLIIKVTFTGIFFSILVFILTKVVV